MEWVRLDVSFFDHPRTGGLSTRAQLAYLSALCWCGRHEQGWIVPKRMLGALGISSTAARELVESGCWEPVEGGWHIHDAEDYQPDAEHLQAVKSVRSESGRKGGMASAKAKALAKAQANASANAGPNGRATGKQPASTSTSTSLSSSSSLETHEDFHSPVDDDDPDIVQDALTLLGLSDLDRRETEVGNCVGNRDAWLEAACTSRRIRHAEQIAALDLGSYPDAVALARHLDPPRKPKPALTLVTRDMRPECVTCSTSGMVFNDSGEAVRCPACNTREPA